TIQAYDPNYVNPYIQNLTLSITKDVNSHLTLDARYIGTLTRKNFNSLDLNTPNFQTNGLKEAFDLARAGKDSSLLNRMFQGINIAGTGCDGVAFSLTCGAVGGPDVAGLAQTGALHLRASSTLRSNLANGNYAALAGQLAQLNYSTFPGSGNESLPPVGPGENGAVLRLNKFDENFILTNPQFGCTTTYGCTSGGAILLTNGGHSNYHSLQVLQTLRNVGGFNFQTSYTWSKDLGAGTINCGPGGCAFTDPRNQASDYTLLRTNRTHVVRTYGSFDLPVGPGRSLAGNTHGVLGRIIEGWQTSWIINLQTGAPLTINA